MSSRARTAVPASADDERNVKGEAADEEGGPAAKAPSLGFGKWSALAKKQKMLQPLQLGGVAAGKAIAMQYRKELDGGWQDIFVVPNSRYHNGYAELFDEDGQPIHEEEDGICNGLQLLAEMQIEMEVGRQYYRIPEASTPVPSPSKSFRTSGERPDDARTDGMNDGTGM